jgi:uncharacterized protein (TIGR02145 family)
MTSNKFLQKGSQFNNPLAPMRRILIFLIVNIGFTINVKSQNSAMCIAGDTISIGLDSYRGELVWEQSTDQLTWTAISGQANPIMVVVPETTTCWVRAVVSEENCPRFYEKTFQLTAIDTTHGTFDAEIYQLHSLANDAVISVINGTISFPSGDLEPEISPGDYIQGLSGIAGIDLVEAIVIQNGFIVIYTSSTNLTIYDLLHLGASKTGKVRGRIFGEDGYPLVWAKVIIGDDSVLTDINGVFVFEYAEMRENLGYVTATKAGYFEGSRSFIPLDTGNDIEIRLLNKNLIGTFTASEGGVLIGENLRLTFPSNGVSLNGQTYSAQVRVFSNYINPESIQFHKEMPGNLFGNQSGNLRGLTSFGMTALRMEDMAGNELQIIPGNDVEVVFSMSTTLAANAPDTIDLWSFNEDIGLWEDEGEATREANTYIAQLPHFSFWNCDAPWDAVILHGTVNGIAGSPLSGLTIQIGNNDVGFNEGNTNFNGEFAGLVPANQVLIMNIYYSCIGILYPIITNLYLGPLSADTVVIINNVVSNQLLSITGEVHDCNDEPVSGGYVLSAKAVHFLENGVFEFYSCLSADSIRFVKENSPMIFGDWLHPDLNWGANDLGILMFCGGDTIVSSTVDDIDGHVYTTVKYGDKWWMVENLRTSRYADGSLIPNVTEAAQWITLNTGAWCNYNNDNLNDEIYGKLYNAYTVQDSRNVCPAGWHVPDTLDWAQMELSLGLDSAEAFINGFHGQGINLSGRLKAVTSLYNGANLGATNESGFTAIPSGTRRGSSTGNFGWLGEEAIYWGNNEYNDTIFQFNGRWLYRTLDGMNSGLTIKRHGYAIRCVID